MSIGVLLALWLLAAVLVVTAFSIGAALGRRRGREEALRAGGVSRAAPHRVRLPLVRPRRLHGMRGPRR